MQRFRRGRDIIFARKSAEWKSPSADFPPGSYRERLPQLRTLTPPAKLKRHSPPSQPVSSAFPATCVGHEVLLRSYLFLCIFTLASQIEAGVWYGSGTQVGHLGGRSEH